MSIGGPRIRDRITYLRDEAKRSSNKGHRADALALTDERRDKLRKASGEQISRDPEMSEWGNPRADSRIHRPHP